MKRSNWVYSKDKEYSIAAKMINDPLLLGFGNTSPWTIEAEPDTFNDNISNLSELFGFIPFTIKQAALRTASNGGGENDITLDGQHYTLLTETTKQDLNGANATHLYLEARLNHDQLPVSTFRSFGIYNEITLDSGVVLGTDFILAADVVSSTLIYAESFSPLFQQAGLSQLFRLIISIF